MLFASGQNCESRAAAWTIQTPSKAHQVGVVGAEFRARHPSRLLRPELRLGGTEVLDGKLVLVVWNSPVCLWLPECLPALDETPGREPDDGDGILHLQHPGKGSLFAERAHTALRGKGDVLASMDS